LRPSALLEAETRELFRHLVDAFTGRARIPVVFTFEGDCELPPETKVALYRIAQETLNNIIKHAAANKVEILIFCQDSQVSMTIGDDGRGFDPHSVSSEHLGLAIMKERAESIGGQIVIKSGINEGSRVEFTWRAVVAQEGK
jgi:signal transduction histidine kinase